MLNVTDSDIEKSNIVSIGDTVYYDITLVRKPMACPYCGGQMIGHGHKLRLIKHPALRNHSGVIRYHANRYICKECSRTAFERNPFSFAGFNSSFLLMQDALRLIGNLNYNLLMISDELGISTTQLSRYIDSYITIPPRPLPECPGIDELHSRELSRRNASYLCILVDNERRTVWDILDSRSKMSLSLFFSRIPRDERLKVKYVTIDMWEPYRDVAKQYFPNCIVAVDPFHVIKHLQDGFERLRIDLMKSVPYGSNAYYLLKKWSWLLTKDNVDLDNDKVYNSRFKMKLNRRDLRGMIFSTFPELSDAYDLKELYRRVNRDCSYDEASDIYDDVVQAFRRSGIRQFDEFTEILVSWKEEILNSFLRPYSDRKLSNSFTENVNGKLRTYLSVSRGISNFSRFRKRVIYAMSRDVQYALSPELSSDSVPRKRRDGYNKIRD